MWKRKYFFLFWEKKNIEFAKAKWKYAVFLFSAKYFCSDYFRISLFPDQPDSPTVVRRHRKKVANITVHLSKNDLKIYMLAGKELGSLKVTTKSAINSLILTLNIDHNHILYYFMSWSFWYSVIALNFFRGTNRIATCDENYTSNAWVALSNVSEISFGL